MSVDVTNLIHDNFRLSLDGRQEGAIKRFTNCIDVWGILLLHKVGTGKTITSLLIALNTFRKKKFPSSPENPVKIVAIAPIGIFSGFIEDLITNILFFPTKNEAKQQFNNVLNDLNTSKSTKTIPLKFFDVYFELENYEFDSLIYDLNNKTVRDLENTIVIIDEAHRLLTNDIFNSTEAGGAMKKHPIIDDLLFQSSAFKALRMITMSGTPMQQTPADLCKFGNFLSKSHDFDARIFAKKMADLVCVSAIIKNISFIKSSISGLTTILYGLSVPTAVAAFASGNYSSLGPIFLISMIISGASIAANYAAVNYAKSHIDKKAKEYGLNTEGGGKKTKKNKLNQKINKKNTKKNKYKKQYGGEEIVNKTITMSTAILAQSMTDGTYTNDTMSSLRAFTNTSFIGNDSLTNIIQPSKSGLVQGVKSYFTNKITTGTNALVGNLAAQSVASGLENIATDQFIYTPFLTETKDLLNTISEPVFNIKLLANKLSKYISIYDYELQDRINLVCLKDINEILNNTLTLQNQDGTNLNYNNLPKDLSVDYDKNLSFVIELNAKKRISNIEELNTKINNPSDCNTTETPDTTNKIDTRFPERIQRILDNDFDKPQMDVIKRFILDTLTDKEKAIFYLNKYEKVSLDYKERINYYANNFKFISNYSTDLNTYYSCLDLTEPNRYDKYTYKKYLDATAKPNEKPIFECPKFKIALDLIITINKGSLPLEKNSIQHPHGKGSNADEPGISSSFNENKEGVYLPLVYSYNEDFGLGLFANYLTSLGYKYILINKFQKNVNVETTSNGESLDLLDRNKKLAFKTNYNPDSNTDDPICVLIDPTMTEGLNATLNPAIIVLDACNTFGDFEQVEGRILRKYNSPYKTKRVKVVYQFITRVNEQLVNSYFEPAKIPLGIRKQVVRLGQKAEAFVDTFEAQKSRENILGFTFSEYMFASTSFQYASPDNMAWNKIMREKKNLENFEKSIKYGIQASDLTESLYCLSQDSENFNENEPTFLNLNLSGNENQDLFFDCKTKERAIIINNLDKRISTFSEDQQKELQEFVGNVFDERDRQYKSSFEILVELFIKNKENRENIKELEKMTDVDVFFGNLYHETFMSKDEKTKIAIFAMFISTSINDTTNPKIEYLLDLLSKNKPLNINSIKSTKFFTPQVEQFQNYINRKIKEATSQQQIEKSTIESTIIPISPPPENEISKTISSFDTKEHDDRYNSSPTESNVSNIIAESTPFMQNGTQVKDKSGNLAFIHKSGKVINQLGRSLITNAKGNVRLEKGNFVLEREKNPTIFQPAESTRVYDPITGKSTNDLSARLNLNGTNYNVKTANDLLQFLSMNPSQEPRDFKMNPLSQEDIQKLENFVKPFSGGKSKKKNKNNNKNKTRKNK
jgi:hypothetical protein